MIRSESFSTHFIAASNTIGIEHDKNPKRNCVQFSLQFLNQLFLDFSLFFILRPTRNIIWIAISFCCFRSWWMTRLVIVFWLGVISTSKIMWAIRNLWKTRTREWKVEPCELMRKCFQFMRNLKCASHLFVVDGIWWWQHLIAPGDVI